MIRLEAAVRAVRRGVQPGVLLADLEDGRTVPFTEEGSTVSAAELLDGEWEVVAYPDPTDGGLSKHTEFKRRQA